MYDTLYCHQSYFTDHAMLYPRTSLKYHRTHPYFISIEKYKEIIDATGLMNPVTTADWVKETIASWRHSIWVGVYDPRGFIFKPNKYLKCVRDAYCLERMHRAFDRGLMQYGMFAATKKAVGANGSDAADVVQEGSSSALPSAESLLDFHFTSTEPLPGLDYNDLAEE